MVAPPEKAAFLGSQFDSKQCCEQFVSLLSCFLPPRCNSLDFGTPVFLGLLFEFCKNGGVDPLRVFPLILKMVADIISPKQRTIFWGPIRLGSFPEC